MSPTSAFPTNENNIIQYPKSDPRRLFVLLYAIETLDRPTINTISAYTGLNKGLINTNVNNLVEFYRVEVTKEGPVYAVKSWGDILNKEGVMRSAHGN